MPKMSDTMTEGVIAAWVKKVGDKVKAGEVLAEVETDKATMELESYEDGVLLYIGVEAGKAVPVDGIIAVVGKEGVDYTPLLSSSPSNIGQTSKVEKQEVALAAPIASTPVLATSSDGRTKISPLAKKLAEEKGIDVKTMVGTGENGRIVKRDVESFAPMASKTAATLKPLLLLLSLERKASKKSLSTTCAKPSPVVCLKVCLQLPILV